MTLEQIMKRKDVPDDIKELLNQLYSEKKIIEGIDTGNVLQSLFERANDGIVIIQDERTVYINPRMAEMLDYTEGEITESPFLMHFPPAEQKKVLDTYKRRMAGEDVPSKYETVLISNHGKMVNVEINAGLSVYNGRPANLAIIRD
ncbi:MAG: PAS domain S-box protein, partial [Candidatus Hodarchaeales archaeon]